MKVANVDTCIPMQMSNYCCAYDDLCSEDKDKLFDLIVEYAKTPIEDREEEKKFYLRHRWLEPRQAGKNYLNCIRGTNEYWLDYKNEIAAVQTQFTKKEIENIKYYNNTDLKDFEPEEVEE